LPELGTQVARLHRDYQAAQYETVVRELPDLFALIDGVPRITATEERPRGIVHLRDEDAAGEDCDVFLNELRCIRAGSVQSHLCID
jgi:hypothetical protein